MSSPQNEITDFVIKGLLITGLGGFILTVFNENLNVIRTKYLIVSATRKLRTAQPSKIKKGVQILIEIAIAKPFRRQEMIDIIVMDVFRRYFNRNSDKPEPYSVDMANVFIETIKALLSVPRKDDNGHILNIDLHNIYLVSTDGSEIYMQKSNFKDVVMWGSHFENVNFSRSSFENADIAGAYFINCGLEYVNMSNTKITWHDRPTTVIESLLTETNIEDAFILKTNKSQLFLQSYIDPQRREKLLSKSNGVIFGCNFVD